MPRVIRGRAEKEIEMPENLLRYLTTGEHNRPDDVNKIAIYTFRHNPDWMDLGPAITAAWIKEHPGTRPAAWWWWDAPKVLTGSGPEASLRMRQKVSGTGVAAGSNLGHGMTDFFDVDPADPPMVESQAAYLMRHGLLEPGEKERLEVIDFKPVPGNTSAFVPGAWEAGLTVGVDPTG